MKKIYGICEAYLEEYAEMVGKMRQQLLMNTIGPKMWIISREEDPEIWQHFLG